MATNTMKLGLVLSATDKMSRIIDQATKKSTDKLKRFENTVKGINSASNKMLVAGGIAAAGIYKSVLAAEDGEASEKKLLNVFKSMWGDNGAANKAGKVASDYAEKLSLQIGVEDDIIRLTQAKLATFSSVSNKTGIMSGVFDRATRAAFDMGAVGFGEAAQNAVMLGKALQSPMTGIKALKKTGALNDSDILNIQNIYKTNGKLAAQKAILAAVERQVKGTGIASVKATDIMKTGFSKIVEEIGGAFLPTVKDAQNIAAKNLQKTIDWIKNNRNLIQTIAKIAVVLIGLAVAIRIGTTVMRTVIILTKAYNVVLAISKAGMIGFRIQYYSMIAAQKIGIAVTKSMTAMQWLWNAAMSANPIVLIVIGIAALVAIVVVCWKKFATFRAVIKTVWETVKGFGNILKQYVVDRIKGIISGLGSMGRAIALLFKGKFKEAGAEAVKGVKELAGYDAKMKAVTSTKKLVTNVSQNYTQKLKEENKAQKQQAKSTQVTATKTTNTKAVEHKKTNVVYSPTINIGGGTAKDKQDFASMLKTHKKELQNIFIEISNNNKRLSYS